MDTINQLVSTKQRDTTIDIIKGFAMIAVVLLHINFLFPKWTIVNTSSILGGLWHVALFFVVSGWFLKDSRLLDFKTFTKGKIINLYLKAMYVYIPLVLLHNVFLKVGWLYDDVAYRHGFLSVFSFSQILSHIGLQFLFTQREPFAGAMWFVDSLFLGLIIYSLITIAVSKLCKVENITNRILIRFIICFCFAFLSAMLRDIWGINIPKISNTLSILVLICIGQALGSFKLRFDNKLLLLLSLVIFLQYTVLTPSVALNSNKYKDVVFLVISSVSSLYVFGFIAKKIANTNLGG